MSKDTIANSPKMFRFDPHCCLVNLAASLLEHFHLPHEHNDIPEVTKAMQNKEQIVFLLFDGMGKSLVEKHLPPTSFLRQHRFMTIDSVFPPTTVAATNAFLSGRFPQENGWLGWWHYHPQFDRFIESFSGRDQWTKEPTDYGNPMTSIGHYQSIFEQVSQARKDVACLEVFPAFRPNGASTLEEWFKQISDHLKQNTQAVIYGYWTSPDSLAHIHGVDSLFVKQFLMQADQMIEAFAKEHPQTCILVMADHSLIDVHFMMIDEHPDFYQTLKRPFAIEQRAATFYVKEDQKEHFEELFARYYGKWFELYSREEVLKQHIFGLGKEHPSFTSFLGDYLAVAIADRCFDYVPDDLKATAANDMVATHAGGVKAESEIDLFVINA